MKTHMISFNSQTDLARQIKNFKRQHPTATYDDAEIKRAEKLAGKMDNERKREADRATLIIEYSEPV